MKMLFGLLSLVFMIQAMYLKYVAEDVSAGAWALALSVALYVSFLYGKRQ